MSSIISSLSLKWPRQKSFFLWNFFQCLRNIVWQSLKLNSYIWKTWLNILSIFLSLVQVRPPFLGISCSFRNFQFVSYSLYFKHPFFSANWWLNNLVLDLFLLWLITHITNEIINFIFINVLVSHVCNICTSI